ncbi:CPBP family intramembrane glutamic endopeptidase [candidate division KSB1 bacterium]
MNVNNITLQGIGFLKSLAIFGAASIVLILETHFLIPYLSGITGWEPVIFWFIVAGLGIFLILLLTAVIILKNEGYDIDNKVWNNRLRFRKITKSDWLLSLGALLVIGVFSALIFKMMGVFVEKVSNQPPFMSFEPLDGNRYWILAIWFPYWILNIMSEEILWRGVILPRQEVVFGRFAWLLNGFLWGIFHIAFGWQLLLSLLPILFIQPFVVQRTKNSWTGVIIHAGINGTSFIAISLGLI